jgi:hypothetical protein
MVQNQPGQIVRPYLEKTITKKKGLVEWLKVWALNSNPSTTKKRKKRKIIQPLKITPQAFLIWLSICIMAALKS